MIALHCMDAAAVHWPDADLVIADPPWSYGQRIGAGCAEDHYAGVPTERIAALLDAIPARRLALWCTWPLLGEWTSATAGWSWGRPRTGGAWTKSAPGDTGHYGPGYHWAGCSELVLVYTRRGSYTDRGQKLRNAWIEPRTEHSRKPVTWQAQMIRRWCPPGGLVLDPYAGLGSVAEAVEIAGEDRRYLGTEIDPTRHAAALARIMR